MEEQVVPVLRVQDAPRAVTWYERLGFRKEWEHQFEPGFPRFVSVARGSVRLYLSEHTGDARPDTLIHLYVEDVDSVAAEFGVPIDEEGLAGRECQVTDPDGNRLRIATRRAPSPTGDDARKDLDYAFPHSSADEARRLELFQQRVDPLTIRRIERLGIGPGAICLEIGGGRGSITGWLAERVGPNGRVTATDLEPDFLEAIDMPNVEVLRHDIRTETFPEQSFDLVHARAVLMHLPADSGLLRRMVSWLRPGGWLLLEEPDFGMWLADSDPLWAGHPSAWHRAFPSGSLSRGRWLLAQIPTLGLADVGADGEVDIVEPATSLAEFYRLSMEAIGPAAVEAGALTVEEAAALVARPNEPDFLSCGFVHIGVWGRRP